ncbi:MAG: bifunctional phosphoribosylaminoimidazolecarboxamide formyltransferase/IMP cyclohydrolase, partial [Candidatus Omnitrophica bacterium]|nr:bifunctional phosphoribosylaminoimidazolecarboxamide formyltransferase/IMP cyclohydrolase [Candidatus Omnitrophota bacterium]
SFGGIISVNRKVDKETAREIIKSEFKEGVIAPSYSKEALKMFSVKKNFVVLEADLETWTPAEREIRTTFFGYLVQDRDALTIDKNTLRVVTKKKPSARELKDLLFAWKVAKFVRSNAIVVARNQAVLGIGGGQPSRVGAAKIALAHTGAARGAVLASDGFFPKEDSIKLAYRKGIRAIISPGGSIKDKDIIKLCDSLGVCMLFTGIRHFRH